MVSVEGGATIIPQDILKPGFIEDLVRSGRIPVFYEGSTGGRRSVFCMIPPEGVQFGDKAHTNIDISVRFSSPDGGINKGWAELVVIDNPQRVLQRGLARKLRDRVDSALATLPVGPPYYT